MILWVSFWSRANQFHSHPTKCMHTITFLKSLFKPFLAFLEGVRGKECLDLAPTTLRIWLCYDLLHTQTSLVDVIFLLNLIMYYTSKICLILCLIRNNYLYAWEFVLSLSSFSIYVKLIKQKLSWCLEIFLFNHLQKIFIKMFFKTILNFFWFVIT